MEKRIFTDCRNRPLGLLNINRLKSLFLLFVVFCLLSPVFAQDPEEHYRQGVKFYLLGDFKQSISEMDKALQINPGFEKAKKLRDIVIAEKIVGKPSGELAVEIGDVTISETYSAKEGFVPAEFLIRRLLALESTSEYTLGTDDVLEISVWGVEELAREVVVRPDGRISFPLVGDAPARGLTPTLLAEILTVKLSFYVKNPKVTVIVKKVGIARKEVFIIGEVKSPGVQEITEGMGVLELLSRVGGFTENAGSSSVKILRSGTNPLSIGGLVSGTPLGDVLPHTEGTGGQATPAQSFGGQVISVNLDEIIIKGDLSQNVMLQPRDVVYVPRATKPKGVFILGEISKPGIYKLEEAPSLLELVTIAGGFTKDAVPSSTKVIRGEPGKPVVLSSNLDRVISRADMSENLALSAGDIVYVPRIWISNVNYWVSQVLPSIQFTYYIYGIARGIWGP